MPTRTISITEEAYTNLASRKEARESFSEVINRITGGASLLDIAGILTHEEASEMRRAIKGRRVDMRRRMDQTAMRMR